MQRTWVPSLVSDLGSHTLRDVAKEKDLLLFPDQGQGHDVSLSPSYCNSNNNDIKQNHTYTWSPSHVLGLVLGFWAVLMARPGQPVDRLWPDTGDRSGPRHMEWCVRCAVVRGTLSNKCANLL